MLLGATVFLSCIAGLSAIRHTLVADEVHQHQRVKVRAGEWFCHGLDCPEFEVIEVYKHNAIELRDYKPSVWASTNLTGLGYDTAARMGFKLLLKYFSGGNADEVVINMTAPVKVRATLTPGKPKCERNFVVSFMIPFEHQAAPPAPNDTSVYIDKVAGGKFYVSSFDKWIDEFSLVGHVTDLLDDLKALKLDHDKSHFYSAVYDSPETFKDRHNEVWVAALDAPPPPPLAPEKEPPAPVEEPPAPGEEPPILGAPTPPDVPDQVALAALEDNTEEQRR